MAHQNALRDQQFNSQVGSLLGQPSVPESLPVVPPPQIQPPPTKRNETPTMLQGAVTSLLGIRVLQDGVLFVQPGNLGKKVSIAGEFNQWSPTATPMHHNQRMNVLEAHVKVPPGTYQYRLIVDGQWQADWYNELPQVLNTFNEPNSIVVVKTMPQKP